MAWTRYENDKKARIIYFLTQNFLIGPDEECSFVEWTSKIPQGFSCGLAITQPNGCNFDQYVPVNCSEVILKVGTPRHCDGGNFGSDCFDFPNWT